MLRCALNARKGKVPDRKRHGLDHKQGVDMSGRYWLDCPACKELVPYTDDEQPFCECGWNAEKTREPSARPDLMTGEAMKIESNIQIKINLCLMGTAPEIYTELEHIQQFLIDAISLGELATVLNTEKNAHDIQIRFLEKDKGEVDDG